MPTRCRSKQRYNKGSDGLPVECQGPANHRMFAKTVASVRNVTAWSYDSCVLVRDFTEEGDWPVQQAALMYDMVEVHDTSEEERYVHKDLVDKL